MKIAQIASIPERTMMLKKTVESLLPQMDEINVMLNNYERTPKFLLHDKINVTHLNNEKGDAGKFYGLKGKEGYIFTCDDDLVYPPDYAKVMIEKLQEYGNQVIVTNHGRIMNPRPITSIYSDRKQAFHCLKEERQEVFLDIGGTGVMAWHSDYFFPDYERITKKNMADIWIVKFAFEQDILLVLNPHPFDWFNYLNPENTIWDYAYYHPEEATKLYNSIGYEN